MRRQAASGCVLLVCGALGLPMAALAHDGTVHASPAEASAHAAAPLAQGVPLPLNLGGPFRLTDQHGRPRTEADPDGNLQLVFFGYASCREICSAALPQMAGIAAGLKARAIAVTPLMVTVDPARDTAPAMIAALARFSPDFVGLTGSAAELQAVYDLFAVESSVVFEDPEFGPVYAHGSFFYLLDGAGRFLTVIPPILSDDRVMDIVTGYAVKG